MTAVENYDDPGDALDAFLSGDEPDWDADPEPPPDLHRADAMLARLARLRSTRAREREAAEERIRQVVTWQAEREGVYDRQEQWLLDALARYHEAVLLLNRDALTIHLPSGDLVSRKAQPEWVIVEPEKVIASVLPERALARLVALRGEFLAAVDEVITENAVMAQAYDVVKVAPPGWVEVSKSGLKKYGTRRDEKNRPVAWGISPSGEAIPGIAVSKPGRDYDVVLRTETEGPDDE